MVSQNPNQKNSLYSSIDVRDLAEDLVPDNTSPSAPLAVADEIQWPLAKDEVAVKVDDSHYFFSFGAPKDSDSYEEGEDRQKPDRFGSDMLRRKVSEKAKKKKEALDGSLHLFDKLPMRNPFFMSCPALLTTNLSRALHSYVVKQGHVSCQEWLNLTESNGDGLITGNDATKFFALSNLPCSQLKQFWDLADTNQQGFLGFSEFVTAMQLVSLEQCGMLDDCHKLFDQLSHCDPVIWNIVLSGLSGSSKSYADVIRVFMTMLSSVERLCPILLLLPLWQIFCLIVLFQVDIG
ncbi:EH domain [Sesbania bispinosa]|nr:EH domain [Sesbania bispinosa]